MDRSVNVAKSAVVTALGTKRNVQVDARRRHATAPGSAFVDEAELADAFDHLVDREAKGGPDDAQVVEADREHMGR